MTLKPKHLLVAPLDWGMGHTTRSIPIIRHLLATGNNVTFAGNSAQRSFIDKHFELNTIHLDGYNITYAQRRSAFALHLLMQIPSLIKVIHREHEWLHKQLDDNHYDGVISDNRYGLHTTRVPTAIVTHQLRIQTGRGQLADDVLQRLHYKFLSSFGEIWVPDIAETPNLAGVLSHPRLLPPNNHYIGLLSQLPQLSVATDSGDALLILLSGPEPQRTILADMLWKQVKTHNGPVIFVDGSDNAHRADIPAHVTWYPLVGGDLLPLLLQKASVVICRSGYSTIMDLVRANRRAVLIPTPGQPEQEYLAKHLHSKNMFFAVAQNNFDLATALKNFRNYNYVGTEVFDKWQHYESVINRWLGCI